MKDNFRLARGFLIASIAILVPLLLMSLWASNHAITHLERDTYQAMYAGVERTAAEIEQLYTEYKGRAAALSTDDVIRTDFWQQNPSRYHATRNLERVAAYSSGDVIVFLQTPDGDIFSSRGFSRADTFFETTLHLDTPSLQRVRDLLSVQDQGATLLEQRNLSSGYFLLHYPLIASGLTRNMTANFVLPYSNLSHILLSMAGEVPVYVRFSLSDGSQLCCLLSKEKMTVLASLPQEETETYTAIEQSVSTLNGFLTVHYDPDKLYRSVRRGQILNMVLLAAGLLLSALISFFFTARRIQNLKRLEALAEGQPVSFRFQNEYAFIGNLLADSAHKITTLSTHIEDYSNIIRQQNTLLILSGAIRDRDSANRLLNAAGQELTEEYFFIGVILTNELDSRQEKLSRPLKEDMVCFLDMQGKRFAAFLWEVPNQDEKGVLRREAAAHFMHTAESAGIRQARIGMSHIYRELSMAELALREAVEAAAKTDQEHPVLCCEDSDQPGSLPVQAELENLVLLTDAVREKDQQKALSELERLQHEIDNVPDDSTGQAYLRYCILRALLSAVAEEGDAPQEMLASAMSINFRDPKEFSSETEKLLRQYTSDKGKKASPEEIRQYLFEHYTDPDLSAADVAEFAGISKAHLGAIFKQHFGMTYIEYLSELRLEKARDMLTETDAPIVQIAKDVGYWDHSSFRRKFRARYGVGVAEYRESAQKEDRKQK